MTESSDSIFIQPGDETTGRIRWEQPVLTCYGYIAGATDVHTFTIWPGEDGDEEWRLSSALPGQEGRQARDARLSVLRETAERWLEEFVTSLGATFPGTSAPEAGKD